MKRIYWWLIGGGAVGAAMLLFQKSAQAASRTTDAAIFRQILPSAAWPYIDIVQRAAAKYDVSPFVLFAIMKRESNFGLALSPPNPSGTGDNGHGRGLMQVDDRYWADWLDSNNWGDPKTNIFKGAEILAQKQKYLSNRLTLDAIELEQAAVAAYNAGEGRVLNTVNAGQHPDTYTTGGNYSTDVIALADSWYSDFVTRA
jgi:soluble lytic murein transglycosylase-like protein